MIILSKYDNLEESLNSIVPWEFTQDTKFPDELRGMYLLDDTFYGMSLEKSNFPKVYILKQYRIVEKKVRMWSYIKPDHVRKGFSTLIDFCSTCNGLLDSSHLDGVIIQLPGKINPERLNGLLTKIIAAHQTSGSSQFKMVPVVSSDKQQSYNYAFLIRKNLSPHTLFSSKSFSKYSFDWIAPKNTSPKSVTTIAPNQHKNFLPLEAAEDIVPKAKVVKTIVSVEPSSKYSFKGHVLVDVQPEKHEIIKKIYDTDAKIHIVDPENAVLPDTQALKKVDKESAGDAAAKAAEKAKKAEESAKAKYDKEMEFYNKFVDDAQKKAAQNIKNVKFKPQVPHTDMSIAWLARMFMIAMPVAADKIKKYGFDETKYKEDNFTYVLSNLEKGTSAYYFRVILESKNWVDSDGKLTATGKKLVPEMMQIASNIMGQTKPVDIKLNNSLYLDVKQDMDDYEHNYKVQNKISNTQIILPPKPVLKKSTSAILNLPMLKTSGGESYIPKPPIKTLIDANVKFEDLKSDLPGSGDYVFSKPGPYGHEPDEEIQQKKNAFKNAGFGKLLNNYYNGSPCLEAKGVKPAQSKLALDYTGSLAYDVNSSCRSAFTGYLLNKTPTNIDNVTNDWKSSYFSKAVSLKKAFDQVEGCPFNIWVYRGAALAPQYSETEIHPGKFYIDPAFMSTSLRSTNTFGSNNLKLRIFVPKGSKVLPMLDESKNSGEDEIILPPSSVLKIIRLDTIIDDYNSSKFYIVTAVYTGNIFDSLFKAYKNKFKLEIPESYTMLEAKKSKPKDPKYDPNKKFGGKYNPKITKKAMELLKSGELKLEK